MCAPHHGILCNLASAGPGSKASSVGDKVGSHGGAKDSDHQEAFTMQIMLECNRRVFLEGGSTSVATANSSRMLPTSIPIPS